MAKQPDRWAMMDPQKRKELVKSLVPMVKAYKQAEKKALELAEQSPAHLRPLVRKAAQQALGPWRRSLRDSYGPLVAEAEALADKDSQWLASEGAIFRDNSMPRRNKLGDRAGVRDWLALETAGDTKRFLRWVILSARNQTLSTRDAAIFSQLGLAMLKAMETTDVGERLTSLEAAVERAVAHELHNEGLPARAINEFLTAQKNGSSH
jgi:hypothetical protein